MLPRLLCYGRWRVCSMVKSKNCKGQLKLANVGNRELAKGAKCWNWTCTFGGIIEYCEPLLRALQCWLILAHTILYLLYCLFQNHSLKLFTYSCSYYCMFYHFASKPRCREGIGNLSREAMMEANLL